jgi:hypothetical protein
MSEFEGCWLRDRRLRRLIESVECFQNSFLKLSI